MQTKEEYKLSAEICDIKTINEAELLAIYYAIKITKENTIIYTDSKFSYEGIIKINKREENIWLFEEIDKILIRSKYKIGIKKIKA